MGSIDSWREKVQANPQAVADQFLADVAALPEAERRAVFYWLPSREQLGSALTACSKAEGSLAGLPYGLKDLFDVVGLETTAGSSFLAEERQMPGVTSPIVDKLQSAGAVMASKVATVEFAYGMSGENVWYGDVPHPKRATSLAGGSSNGSAYVVGRGLLPFSIGTDTSGSMRVPAAFCGLYSWRDEPASFGGKGVFPLAQSFDTPGWFAADVESLQTLNSVMLPAGEPVAEPHLLDLSDYAEGLDPELRAAGDALLKKLCATKSATATALASEAFSECFDAYNILGSTEAYAVHAQWLDACKDRYDPVVWGRINRGRNWKPNQFDWAMRKEAAVLDAWTRLFGDYNAVALPITPIASPTKADMTEDFRTQLLSLNTPASLGRCPALTIPLMLENGRSGGIQILFRNNRKEVARALMARL
ncbi:amidase [Cerasicoccus maritimus]|uniref:amidase n=1 Tax=Cerasicoccus maritimus TaxID=490089 RepID=UPI002852A51C|nr:amidase family protein [Cerasicoccus maritimus]